MGAFPKQSQLKPSKRRLRGNHKGCPYGEPFSVWATLVVALPRCKGQRMKFGVTMFPGSLDVLDKQARLAEDMGFDYLGIADSQSLARELYVTLSVAAMSTKRVMLGLTVSNPLTRHPAVTASAIASVNELSGGRAFLGIGSGDSAVLNLGLRPARLSELHHYIQTVREMLAGETGEYRGDRAHVRWAASTALSTGIPAPCPPRGRAPWRWPGPSLTPPSSTPA